jgi:hypothetical protein
MDHAIRISVWEEQFEGQIVPNEEVYIAFKPARFPGGPDWPMMSRKSTDSWFTIKKTELKYWYAKKAYYLRNLWWAFKGKPSWYYAEWSGGPKEAKEIISFLQECFPEKKEIDSMQVTIGGPGSRIDTTEMVFDTPASTAEREDK